MKSWKDWLEWMERPKAAPTTSAEAIERIKDQLVREGVIQQDSNSTYVQLDIRNHSTEEDIAKQVVRALREMTDVVAGYMAKKYHYSEAKLKLLVAEEFYRQATSPSTFMAKNFGDGKLVQ